ncbi:AraC family transcriptional regulator [Butyrivibrio sp. DSM 10294]|uniref:AraC family transcriptional regulator n=1 Tax=Butyrivibrio sp. DSM 10294 TaxID=2972457 RepID=UPI00234EC820|nr:AraC family transcriptional regulator [Butyrivibrio sp. DSM 10294]MDC7293484.1 AraC family transcriptional regulator [Butyrivibrio sp. DSM 10294]
MDWVRTINDAIEYMEENLTEDITLADISKAVNLSAFHFQRAFTLLTGMSPAEYLRKRRLSQAASELVKGDGKVIDIALKFGFNSPESFTKAFTRFHGVSPAQAKKGEPIQFMSRYTVQITIKGGSIMEYKIEKWEEMDLLVHAKLFNAETSETEIPKFWDEYYSNEEYRKIPGYLGVCAQAKSGSDEFKYGIGCKASDVDGVPEGFEVIHIPEYDWAVFKCVGPSPNAIQDMWERIYKEWLPVSEYELIPDVDIENYLPGDPSAADYVSEICIPVKKR